MSNVVRVLDYVIHQAMRLRGEKNTPCLLVSNLFFSSCASLYLFESCWIALSKLWVHYFLFIFKFPVVVLFSSSAECKMDSNVSKQSDWRDTVKLLFKRNKIIPHITCRRHLQRDCTINSSSETLMLCVKCKSRLTVCRVNWE